MRSTNNETGKKYEELLEELKEIGEFRRGSMNVVYRKCGKQRCACNQKGHPGHGPMITLTYNEQGKTRTRSLSSYGVQEMVREQLRSHKRFEQWRKKWVKLNEEICDLKLDEVLIERECGSEDDRRQKKLRKRSSRKSGVKSKG